MTPLKQSVKGLGGCVLAPTPTAYRLKNGHWTHHVAVTISLLRAEPSLRRLLEGTPIACEDAVAQGYRVARRYDDAVMHGLV